MVILKPKPFSVHAHIHRYYLHIGFFYVFCFGTHTGHSPFLRAPFFPMLEIALWPLASRTTNWPTYPPKKPAKVPKVGGQAPPLNVAALTHIVATGVNDACSTFVHQAAVIGVQGSALLKAKKGPMRTPKETLRGLKQQDG